MNRYMWFYGFKRYFRFPKVICLTKKRATALSLKSVWRCYRTVFSVLKHAKDKAFFFCSWCHEKKRFSFSVEFRFPSGTRRGRNGGKIGGRYIAIPVIRTRYLARTYMERKRRGGEGIINSSRISHRFSGLYAVSWRACAKCW